MLTRLILAVCAGCAGAPAHAPPAAQPGCGSASFLPVPRDRAQRGPWQVGVRTGRAADLVVEVWYPALAQSGHAPVTYDLRDAMPPAEAAKIPDADNATLACDCFRDLPLDTAHGPYPTVVFLHGAASFRAQSAFLATHWASRGFVVIAPDLPGIGLAALLGGGASLPTGKALDILDALRDADPAFSFVHPSLDGRVAIVGHSLGAVLATTVADRPEIDVAISLAGVAPPETKASRLALYGEHDAIAPPPADRSAGITIPGAGHLSFTDLCLVGADRGGALAIAKAHGVAVPPLLERLALDGCRPTDAPFATTAPVIRALTAGVLEERMHCVGDVSGNTTAANHR